MAKPYATRSPRGRAAQSVQVLTGEVASTRDGRDITRPLVMGLEQPRDPRLLGAVDWGIYDRILIDDQVFSTLQQRRGAVVSRDWDVLPGDEDDPRSVAAADRFRKTLDRIGWDRITNKMLMAIFYGYAVAEIMWEARDGLMDIGSIRVRHARRFRFDDQGELRLLTRAATQGEQLPPRKFWLFTAGGSDDDEHYGRGLAEWLYWPTLFKRNGLRFWNTFLDKFGSPTALGKYRPGTPREQVDLMLEAMMAIATDSGIALPEGMAVELIEAKRSGTGDFAVLCDKMDAAIAKVVLSQTMTTDNGSSRAQSETHAGVKLEVIRSDADLLSASFNGEDGPARWWTDLNFGPDVAAPIVYRDCEEEADTKAEAEIDVALKSLGWVRTEESFRETFGDGYVRADAASADRTAPAPDPSVVDQPVAPGDNDGQATDTPADPAAVTSFAANDPRPLYVHRKLLNAGDVIAWAQAQGFTSTLPADDMHVTVTYSRKPVDWMKMGGFWGWTGDNADHLVPPGGPRLVEQFGDKAVVLVFFSGHLEQRHKEMGAAGASWDYPDYFPHVTFTYDPGEVDLAAVEPYRGELRFGPEIFEPIVEDWQARLREVSFGAPPGPEPLVTGKPIETAIADASAADARGDATDQLVNQLIAESGYRAVGALTDPMIAAIADATSADAMRAAIDQGVGDPMPFAHSLENASFALRLAEENGDPIDG